MLYGVTLAGGRHGTICGPVGGCGTVFAASTSGKERVLYKFKGGMDGWEPCCGLTVLNGTLYGTTYGGGGSVCDNGCGTVYSVTTDGRQRVLHRFQGRGDGALPYARLTAVHGIFYGTTKLGGTNDMGTIFSITAAGKEQVIYSFQGGNDGSYPTGELTALNGSLYGTASAGGRKGQGIIFALIPQPAHGALMQKAIGPP